MSYKGYYSNPNKRFKRDLVVLLFVGPIALIIYFVSEYWNVIKEWLINIFS